MRPDLKWTPLLSPPGDAGRHWIEQIESRPIQFSVRTLLVATACIAALLVLFRYVPGLGVFLVMTLPLCVACRLRRQVLATPALRRMIVRLPLFVVLFGMFYCAMLGPFTTLISMTDLRTNTGSAGVATIAVYTPLAILCRAAPAARDPVTRYLDWWDLTQWSTAQESNNQGMHRSRVRPFHLVET